MRQTLSIIIICCNEAHVIEACLASIVFADEIIILDSGSQDGTLDICRRYTDNVIETDWPGFGPQKNRALQQATSEWVLTIDADERVTPALADEIQTLLASPPPHQAYTIPFQSYFLQHAIRHGDWGGEQHLRLFKRHRAHFTNVEVHEDLIIEGSTGRLTHKIEHHPYRNIDEIIHKINHYSTVGATLRAKQGKRSTIFGAWLRGGFAFCRSYLLKLGLLDGKAGFLLAVSIAQYTFYRYVKLALMRST